jgi:hypothetical protein
VNPGVVRELVKMPIDTCNQVTGGECYRSERLFLPFEPSALLVAELCAIGPILDDVAIDEAFV